MAVCALALVGASCGGEPADTAPFLDVVDVAGPDAPVVMVVGDSVTYVSFLEITKEFSDRGWNHVITGDVGTTTEDNRDKIRGAAKQKPDVLVIELGTNDAGKSSSRSQDGNSVSVDAALEDTQRQVEAAMDDVSEVTCVIWVDVNTWAQTPIYDLQETGARVNEYIWTAAENHDNVHVAPFADFFGPSAPDKSAWIEANYDDDGLHPESSEAKSGLAGLIAAQAQQDCGI